MFCQFSAAVVLTVFTAPALGGGPVPRGETPRQASKTSLVDLVQTQLNLPGKVKIGKKFQVRDELENTGEYLAPLSVTHFYLSLDDTYDSADLLVGGRRVPPLTPTQGSSAMSPVVLNEGVKPGVYYLIAVADGPREIEERYETNNTRAVKVTVQPADPEKKK